MPKISLWVEDTIAAVAFLAFALFAATSVLSIERDQPKPKAQPAPVKQPALAHPLPYKAVVCQSDYGQKPKCVYYTERSQ